MELSCFACRPGPSAASEARALCLEHKEACKLPDGASLYGTLDLARASEGSLEGSSLGWLYNPVFVVDARGNRVRAWTTFVAGGMAVLEDRFGVEDPFEFWMCEREDMAGLLAELCARDQANRASALSEALKHIAPGSRNAFAQAWDQWVWHREVRARHEALGRWPTSFGELTAVLRAAHPRAQQDGAAFAAFLDSLRGLAVRRHQQRAPA